MRDKLIVYKAGQLFCDAYKALVSQPINGFEQELLFVADYIIERLKKDHSLLQFLAKIYPGEFFALLFQAMSQKSLKNFTITI